MININEQEESPKEQTEIFEATVQPNMDITCEDEMKQNAKMQNFPQNLITVCHIIDDLQSKIRKSNSEINNQFSDSSHKATLKEKVKKKEQDIIQEKEQDVVQEKEQEQQKEQVEQNQKEKQIMVLQQKEEYVEKEQEKQQQYEYQQSTIENEQLIKDLSTISELKRQKIEIKQIRIQQQGLQKEQDKSEKQQENERISEIDQEQENLKVNPSKFRIENILMNLPPDAHPIVFNPAILKQTPLYGQGGHVDHLYLSQLAKGYTDNECGYAISMHMSSIRCLAFHPHLMLLLSGSEDGSVALTDVSHASKRNQNQNLQPEANPLPNQSVLVENVSPYALRDKQIPMKMLDPKWLILNSYFNPLRRRLQMNKDQQRIKCNDEKEKDIMINPEYDVEDQDQQIQQQQLNHTNLISYNPIHCVQFLPYLESNNDRNRKKIQNNIGKLQKENPQVLKMSQDLGCFATGCSDGKISVYGLPDPKMQMIDNNNKFQPNKMFDIIGHKDAVFSIDETQQQSGLYRGVGIPRKGQVNNETRLVSGSADGTVRVWKIKSDGTIPITAQTSGSKDIEHNSFYLQERVFRHTPSISNSVVATWNNERQKIIRNENMNYDKNEIQFLSEREVLEDKWQESDIPSSVIFDPMNMNNVIAGYVSGDIVRFDIETNQESGFSRIGSQNKVERILTISKSRIAPHYSKGLMVPLLVTTNLGYLHLIEPNTLHTMISIKAPSEQNGNSQSNNNFIKSNFIQNKPSNENQTQTYSQQVYYSSLNDRIATLQRRNVQIGSSHIKQKIIEPSPLEMWKYDIKAQLTVRNIFTNATYLQSDSLIAASTNTGQVIMYDIRYNGYMEFGRIRDVNNRNMSSSISQQGLMNIVAHPQHNLLVTGNGDGFIKIYNSNQF